MHLKYLGGKTDHKKYLHVFYLTEHAKLDGWLPKDDKLDQLLSFDEDWYFDPTLWGYHVYYVKEK